MKYLDEYRDGRVARKIVDEIQRVQTKPWVIMEVCGGQTHSIVKNGIDYLLPEGVELVHGPGCPVCVTPLEMIDKAHAIARMPDVIFCSFGDMLRVPGSEGDLFTIKSEGGDVRVVYSPMDCIKIAHANPDKKVVFFAIGFETTAPANAMLAWRAKQEGLKNVSLLVSHVLVPPALAAILQSPENRVQGFLGPGHVCAVMGYEEYEPISAKYHVPIVVSGFEPLDILQGTLMTIRQLETERGEVENQYSRILDREGKQDRAEACVPGLSSRRSKLARHRHYSAKRLSSSPGVRGTRRGEIIRRGADRDPRVGNLYQRRNSARHQKAERLSRLRNRMHATKSVGRYHGFR